MGNMRTCADLLCMQKILPSTLWFSTWSCERKREDDTRSWYNTKWKWTTLTDVFTSTRVSPERSETPKKSFHLEIHHFNKGKQTMESKLNKEKVCRLLGWEIVGRRVEISGEDSQETSVLGSSVCTQVGALISGGKGQAPWYEEHSKRSLCLVSRWMRGRQGTFPVTAVSQLPFTQNNPYANVM